MSLSVRRLRLLAFSVLALSGCGEETTSQAAGLKGGGGSGPDIDLFVAAPVSCVFDCPVCEEAEAPYACPNLGDWAAMPHADTCPAWDGKQPEPRAGKCEASAPTAHAAKYTGKDPDDARVTVMPDGHHLQPAGAAWVFDEPELYAGMTSSVAAIPGTSLVLTVDTGYGDHVVRLIDTAKIGPESPVLGYVDFADPSTLNWGLVFSPPDRAFVATDNGVVQAFSIDLEARTIARDDGRSITLPQDSTGGAWYTSGVAVSPDGKRLVVSSVTENQLLVYDVEPGGAGYGSLLGEAELGDHETFAVAFDPSDEKGDRAYVSMWAGKKIIEVDLTFPAAPIASRTFATDKDPEGMAFLDGRWMVVANDFGDTLSLVDRLSGSVTAVPVDTESTLPGTEPSTLAYDAQSKRLYVTLAAIGALGVYSVDMATSPPSITPAGRLPTLWWPSGVVVDDDGGLVVSSLRGDGTGPSDLPYTLHDGDAYVRLHGGIQRIPAPSADDLAAGEALVKESISVGRQEGYPEVSCPAGEDDFPVPETNTEKSPVIDHVFVIVRENKTFDALFGDFPGAKGSPDRMLKATKEDEDAVWPNTRALGAAFTISDNFYTAAEISSLGHVWTTYGRSSDYNERTWAMAAYGRYARPSDIQNGGVADAGQPDEGSMFDWLARNGVEHDILGEGIGLPALTIPSHPPNDFKYPGGFIQNPGYPDTEKACYLAGRARVRCDIGNLVYMTLPNDHTRGVSPSAPTPELMCAVNDEATGMVVSAISKSPLWKSSIVIVTEDDPAQGGDHVDQHRTILVVASPWVKRGYVSKTHIDVPSIHKIIAHVFGIPYPNFQVENAGLPLDMFTSTPDYSPYEYIPRRWPLECGDKASAAESKLTGTWDLSDVDRSPGLDDQVTRWMRGKQLVELPEGLVIGDDD